MRRPKVWPAYLVHCTVAVGGLMALLFTGPLFAGGTPTGQWLTLQGQGAVTGLGDYISSNQGAGLDDPYRLFIEVSPGQSLLQVDLFDPDVGAGGGADPGLNLDRIRGTSFNSTCQYRLYAPGAGSPTVTLNGTSGGPGHNAWHTFASISNPAAGHWRLEVDMSSAVTGGNDINAYGVRAHDGNSGSGGTEVNVYAEAFLGVGQNPGLSPNFKEYTVHGYITSFNSFHITEFDWDDDSTGDRNRIDFSSRTGTLSASDTNLSDNDEWETTTWTGWTTDQRNNEYGLWDMDIEIQQDTTTSGNYGVYYLVEEGGDVGPPASNTPSGAFRTYFPDDSGNRPAKIFLTEQVNHVSGPNPPVDPVLGTATTQVEIEVVLFNNTPRSIEFGSQAGHRLTANLPGLSAVEYVGGSAFAGRGTIESQPGDGATTGSVVFNPGVLPAGTTTFFRYRLDVSPNDGSFGDGEYNLTGANEGAGISATYLDETTTEHTFGPMALLVAEEGEELTLAATVARFEAGRRSDGDVVVEWETSTEVGTAGFRLLREEPGHPDGWVAVYDRLLPALMCPEGGQYRLLDSEVPPQTQPTYKLVEVETDGDEIEHGPYTPTLEGALPDRDADRSNTVFRRQRRQVSSEKRARLAELESDVGLFVPERDGLDPSLRITVKEDGCYAITAGELSQLLQLSQSEVMDRLDTHGFQLQSRGRDIPYLADATAGLLRFYGHVPEDPHSPCNVYWLRPGAGLPLAVESGPRPGSEAQTFWEALHVEEDRFALTALFDDPEADFWLWEVLSAGDPTIGRRTFSLTVPAPDPAPHLATLTVQLLGVTETDPELDHHAEVWLNGTYVGETRWGGKTSQVLDLTVDSALLQAGENQLEIVAIRDAGVPFSLFYLDSFDLLYLRQAQAVSDRLLVTGRDARFTVGGFTNGQIQLLDVTDPDAPMRVAEATVEEDAPGYRVLFSAQDGHRYLVTAAGACQAATLERAFPADLTAPCPGARYVIITPSELVVPALALAEYRQQQGLSAKVVDLRDIYDTFRHGLPGPKGIQAFLEHAWEEWDVQPRFVVLIGEGTFDYRNVLEVGDHLLPSVIVATPYGLFASDLAYADVEGQDGVPELAIGRFPVVSGGELLAMLDKIEAYEQGLPETPRALLMADPPDLGGDYPAELQRYGDILTPYQLVEVMDLGSYSPGTARGILGQHVQDGVDLVTFLGHGGLDSLSNTRVLTIGDLPLLDGAGRQPVFVVLSCVAGRFGLPGFDSLGELLVLQPDGGATVFFGPTGLVGARVAIAFGGCVSEAFTGEHQTLGEALVAAFSACTEEGALPADLRTYSLLGDPALHLPAWIEPIQTEAQRNGLPQRAVASPPEALRGVSRSQTGKERGLGCRVTPVADPSHWLLLVLAVGMLLIRRRRAA